MSTPFVRAAAAAFTLFSAAIIYAGYAPQTSARQANSTVSINGSPEGIEGAIGSHNFSFNLSRTGDLTTPCTAFFETNDGTAYAPEDYASTNGSVTMGPGSANALVIVRINGELFMEGDESFQLRLTGTSAGCGLGVITSGTAVIVNDEPLPVPNMPSYTIEGDVAGTPNGTLDAAIRANDIVRLRRFVLGLETPTLSEFRNGDINANCGDGQINSADIALLRQWLLAGVGQIPSCGPSAPGQTAEPELRVADHLDPVDDMWPL